MITHEQFRQLLDAYFGARDHERWAKDHGTQAEYRLAILAVQEARLALEKGVFGP